MAANLIKCYYCSNFFVCVSSHLKNKIRLYKQVDLDNFIMRSFITYIHQILLGTSNETVLEEHISWRWEIHLQISTRKVDGKGPLRKSIHKWEGDIKMQIPVISLLSLKGKWGFRDHQSVCLSVCLPVCVSPLITFEPVCRFLWNSVGRSCHWRWPRRLTL
jgi:hypothetical protein